MIIADILDISINLLIATQVLVCVLLLGIILMQRPKQEGLGAAFGAGLTDQAFGARTTDVLQKGTVYLGTAFMVICMTLSLLLVHRSDARKSNLGELPATATEVIQDIKKDEAKAQESNAVDALKELDAQKGEETKPEQKEEVVPEGPPPVPEPIVG